MARRAQALGIGRMACHFMQRGFIANTIAIACCCQAWRRAPEPGCSRKIRLSAIPNQQTASPKLLALCHRLRLRLPLSPHRVRFNETPRLRSCEHMGILLTNRKQELNIHIKVFDKFVCLVLPCCACSHEVRSETKLTERTGSIIPFAKTETATRS